MSSRPTPLWATGQRRNLDAVTRADELSLIVGTRGEGLQLLEELGHVLGLLPCSLSEAGLRPTPVRDTNDLLARLGDSTLLYDVEALCWQPWLRADVFRFLRMLARHNGVVVLWPGDVHGSTASFSAPGRHDHVSFDARGCNVLRPVASHFPDEVPFTLERIR